MIKRVRVVSCLALWALLPPLAGAGEAACATAHPEATAACIEILEVGGNAVDAAVAASAALAVVEPTGSGLGGGGFWLVHRAAENHNLFVDGRETAPLAARPEQYLDADGTPLPERSLTGALAAGIPGEPAALVHLAERYGRLPLARSLAPSVRLAAAGFVVDADLAEAFETHWPRFSEGAKATFAIDGRAPRKGERLLQPDLARLLTALGVEGHDAFYSGPFAQRLVEGVRAAGGHWQMADLRHYAVRERVPLEFHFRDARVVSSPPPSAGGIALAQIFGQLEALGVALPLDDAGRHLLVESMRRAYRDRAAWLGDPDQVFVPQQQLTAHVTTRRMAAGINRDRATPSADLEPAVPSPEGNNTTHLSVLDAEGNRVAATLSINIPFGAAMVVPGTGILLNDELDDFAMSTTASNVYGLIGSRPNLIAPGKRPLSSMTPTFVESPRGLLILGTPGGSRIITMVALGIVEWLGGGDVEAVVSAGRFHHQYLPDVVQMEPQGLDAAQQAAFTARGHALKPVGRRYGDMQAVSVDAAGVRAASDPRGIGLAQVLQVP